jgi:hypothetical protein
MLKPIRCTARDLAGVLELSERRVSELTRVKVFTKPYVLQSSVTAYVGFLRVEAGGLKDERTRCAKLKADLLDLNLQERRGILVKKDAVRQEEFSKARQVRDGVLNVPSRVSGMCAAETDQHRIHSLLTKELLQTLGDLTCETSLTQKA